MSLLLSTIEATERNYSTDTTSPHLQVVATGKDYAGRDHNLFPVVSAPISGPYGEIEGKKGIFVKEKNINVVSNRYEVHQPSEILETFQHVADKTGLQINRILPNEHNGGLMISAKYSDCKVLGENHDVNLTFYTSHCGKYKTFLTLDLLRMACFNQVPTLYKNKDRHIFAEKHYKNALDIKLIGDSLEYIPASITAYEEKAESLNNTKMSFDYFAEMYAKHYKLNKEQKQFDSKVEKLRNVYYNATGQRGLDDSAYKAYQAITFMNTHELRNTAMKAENILTKSSNDSLVFLEELLVEA
jgi:hypothetical protein